jgi:hypothetical protein
LLVVSPRPIDQFRRYRAIDRFTHKPSGTISFRHQR